MIQTKLESNFRNGYTKQTRIFIALRSIRKKDSRLLVSVEVTAQNEKINFYFTATAGILLSKEELKIPHA